MWKAAKMLQKKDLMSTQWSLTQKTEDDPEKSNGKRRMSLFKDGSPKRLHRPSALLHAVRVPLVSLFLEIQNLFI